MKKFRISLIFVSSLLIILICFSPFTASGKLILPTPTESKYINDYTNTLNTQEMNSIISIGKELEDKTTAQAIAVIIDSTNGIPIENYSIDLFRSWGIGQKQKDNGLLILLAINDKSWRVEVGRGLEGTIPDALSNQLMENLAKPFFITGDYANGLLNVYNAFSDEIANEYNIILTKNSTPSTTNLIEKQNKSSSFGAWILLPILLVTIFFDTIFNRGRLFSTFMSILFWTNNRRGPGGGPGNMGGFGGGSSNGGGSSGNW